MDSRGSRPGPDGDGEIRTLDPLLARQVLSQLSYTPTLSLFTFLFYKSGTHLLSHIVSNIVPSAAYALTVVFGMGTGVSHMRIGTGSFLNLLYVLFLTTHSHQRFNSVQNPYFFFP